MLCRRFCQYILHHVAGCNSFATVYSSRHFLLSGPHIIDHDIRTGEMGGTGHALIANGRNATNWTALASVRDGPLYRALHSDPQRWFIGINPKLKSGRPRPSNARQETVVSARTTGFPGRTSRACSMRLLARQSKNIDRAFR